MATSLGEAVIEITADTSGLKKDVKQGSSKALSGVADDAEKSGQKTGKRFGGAIVGTAAKAMAPLAGAFAAIQVGGFLKGSIDEASNFEESINAVRVTYGKAADDVLKIGENSAKAFGLSKVELNDFAVRFSAFAGQIAGKGGDSAKTFEKIAGRATDFASVMNLEVAEAAQLFQSGLAGETEPLRQFGIDLSAAAVEAHAVKKGIADAGGEMTEQQKVQARYSLLMKQTAQTAGDFQNTSEGLANQQRILKATFSNVRQELGSALLPIVTKFFSFLNTSVIPIVQNVVSGLGKGGGGLGGVLETLGGVFERFGGNSETAMFVLKLFGDAIGELVGHGRDLLKTLAPAFQGIVTAAQKLIAAVVPILQDIANRIVVTFKANLPEIKALMTELVGAIRTAVTLIALHWTRISKVITAVWDVIGPYVMAILNALITNIIGVLGGAVKIISGVMTLMMGIFTGDFEMMKKGVVKIFRGLWKILWTVMSSAGKMLEKWLGGWITRQVNRFMDFWQGVKEGFLNKWRTLTTVLSWPFKVAARAISSALSWLWGKVIRPTVGFISKIFQRMGRDIRAVWRNFLRPVLQLLGAMFRWLWQKITRPIFRAIEKAWRALGRGFRIVWRSFLRPIISALGDLFQWLWRRIVRPVIKAVEGAWRGMGRLLRNVYRNTIGKVFGWFGDRAKDTRDIASNAFSAVGDKFGDLGRGLRNTLNNSIKAVFRGFVRAGKWMSDSFQTVVKWIGKRWNQLKSLAAKPIRFVLDTVLNKGLIGGFNKLAEFFDTDKIKPVPVPFKSGGVLPGHTPGRDVHRFTSPTGGALDLSGGEAIMRPEFTRAVGGPRGVAALNRAARGYAQGGVLGDLSGGSGSFSPLARKTLLAAQKLAGVQFNIFQRGNRPATSYSGTSHQGDAVDLGPISRNIIKSLRAMGWAAWDRTGMGNWVPHIHAVPLPGAGFAGGSGIWQAKDFLEGGNGLGGRDQGPRGLLGNVLSALKMGTGKLGGLLGGLNPMSVIQGALDKAMAGYKKFAGSPFGEMAIAAPKKIAETGIDWFTDKIQGLFGGGGGANASWSGGGLGGFSKAQLDNAATIFATAQKAGVGRRGAKIGIMTALQESGLRELSYGDRDSVGPFQQRTPWGSRAARMDTASAAAMFFNGGRGGQPGLKDFAWRSMGLGEAAQRVQVSAYPSAYSKWADEASAMIARLVGHGTHDDGGVWKPGTLGMNASGKEEVVFTNEQWSILRSLVSQSQGPTESWPQPGDTVVFEVEGEPMTATATRVVRSEIKQASGSI